MPRQIAALLIDPRDRATRLSRTAGIAAIILELFGVATTIKPVDIAVVAAKAHMGRGLAIPGAALPWATEVGSQIWRLANLALAIPAIHLMPTVCACFTWSVHASGRRCKKAQRCNARQEFKQSQSRFHRLCPVVDTHHRHSGIIELTLPCRPFTAFVFSLSVFSLSVFVALRAIPWHHSPMKMRLVIMRHAKSSWSSGAQTDHQRPLNERGRRDAPRVAARLLKLGWLPQLICSSDSLRTVETLKLMQPEFGRDIPAELTADLYHAGLDEIIETAGALGHDVHDLMVLGHNPGWEEAVSYLCGHSTIMKTACAALLETRADSWQQGLNNRGGWTLVDLIRPEELP